MVNLFAVLVAVGALALLVVPGSFMLLVVTIVAFSQCLVVVDILLELVRGSGCVLRGTDDARG